VDELQTCADAGFEDAGDRLARRFYRGLGFEERDEGVLRVACDEKAIVTVEKLAQGREAVRDRFGGVVFVVDALGSRGRGEVFVGSLAAVSCVIAGGEWCDGHH